MVSKAPAETTTTHPCHICGFTLSVVPGEVTICPNCGHKDRRFTNRSARLSLVFALTALIFYIPANIFPFMTIELYGKTNSSTIWTGLVSLIDQRSYAIALVVFLASLLIPILKLMILFYLSAAGLNGDRSRFKMNLYHFVEAIGRWSMLDIFLLAILVAMVKLGHLTTVHPGPGSAMFLLVVIFTMLSSAYFDPRLLWENKNETND